MSLSTGYVRTHIYIENMRTRKALSAWIPLVSVFCSSGAVSGIRGKQMTPAIASERSIFSKNHDYNQWRRNHGSAGCWRTPMYVLVAMFNYYNSINLYARTART